MSISQHWTSVVFVISATLLTISDGSNWQTFQNVADLEHKLRCQGEEGRPEGDRKASPRHRGLQGQAQGGVRVPTPPAELAEPGCMFSTLNIQRDMYNHENQRFLRRKWNNISIFLEKIEYVIFITAWLIHFPTVISWTLNVDLIVRLNATAKCCAAGEWTRQEPATELCFLFCFLAAYAIAMSWN